MTLRKLTLLALVPILSVSAGAQAAAITHYGSSCPGNWTLTTYGQPRLGQSVGFAAGCSTMTGSTTCVSVILGLSSQNVPFSSPAFPTVTGCSILVGPDVVVSGGVMIPNDPAYLGVQFYAQAWQYGWSSGPSGTTWSLGGFSDGVEFTIGV